MTGRAPLSLIGLAVVTGLLLRRPRTRRRAVVLTAFAILIMVAIMATARRAPAIDGIPTATSTLTVSTVAVGLSASLCVTGAIEGPALMQIKDNGIYYTLHSASATPASTDFVGNVGDVLEVGTPSLFRAIRSGGADAHVKAQCFRR